ncbi:hypothetical protein AAGF08_16555 [Algoriphagus sp. SE2]|uniref:hypothetical protein n=1 Tax=Algoriphagus sp. SE2 TaxID=3141536 RepID=UPI0031CD80C7
MDTSLEEDFLDRETKSHHPLVEKVPLTGDELQSSVPYSVGFFRRVSLAHGLHEEMGISSVRSKFQHTKDAQKSLSIEIMDGAGELGALLIEKSEEKLKEDFEDHSLPEKTVINEHQTFRVLEKERTDLHRTYLEFIHSKRFLIKVHTQNLSKEELIDFIHLFRLEKEVIDTSSQ